VEKIENNMLIKTTNKIFFRQIEKGLSLNEFWFYWIGLSDQAEEGNYVWVNGDQGYHYEERFWASGQPNNNGDCTYARFDAGTPEAAVYACSGRFPAICEKPYPET